MNNRSRNRFFPILVDLQNIPCLVVGGGRVALRKVNGLLAFGAKVTVVAPRECASLTELLQRRRIEIIRKAYSKEFIKGKKIVFSATSNRATNRRVSCDCKRAGILVNVADDPELCGFILPANLIMGSLCISISTQGKAPFYATEMKSRLAGSISPRTEQILDLAADFRKALLTRNGTVPASAKTKAYRAFLSTDWESLLKLGGKKKSMEKMRAILDEIE